MLEMLFASEGAYLFFENLDAIVELPDGLEGGEAHQQQYAGDDPEEVIHG